MPYTEKRLNGIYDRTSGYSHICHKKLAFRNYGRGGARGAWEVEHSTPRARGGSDRLNNLYAACISCNRAKGAGSTRTARTHKGKSRAPLSVRKRRKAKMGNAVVGGALGAAIGAIFGPPGVVLGLTIGAHLGHKKNPDKDDD